MHAERGVRAQKPYGESAEKRLQQHPCRSLGMVSENHHEHINHTERNSEQCSKHEAIHAGTFTPQRIAPQVPARLGTFRS